MKPSSQRKIALTSLIAAGLFLLGTTPTSAFERYKNDSGTAGSNCAQCHGDFSGTNSPQGTIFPADSKHEMHRGASYMDTDCDLCHTSGDNRNPYTYTSNGTADNIGLGCSGCHVGDGLRAHHVANGVTFCTGLCHDPITPDPESVNPPYYGTPDTLADNPCNDVLASNTGENWSVGDFLGLDNDGDNLYDQADFDCGPPYRVLSVAPEGNDLRVTWETVGGRTDALQASPDAAAGFANVGGSLPIPGVGLVVTNRLEIGGATNAARFYRISSVP